MLILARRKGEKIVIAGNIVVEVLEIDGFKVRLGINAPREITVNREEVEKAIEDEGSQGQGGRA
jgi:carbon storage regulator